MRRVFANVHKSGLAIAVVMALFITLAWRWPWSGGTVMIRSDVKGYWAYLRCLFITHDLGYEAYDFEYVNLTPEGRSLNKYFAGESLMLLPFFLGAHGYAALSGEKTDGLSQPYQRSIGIAALVYALVALLCLRALLRGLRIRDGTIAVILLMLGFGTQLVQYVAVQPGWTHVYSFCAIAAFLHMVQRLEQRTSLQRTLATGALLGLVILIRPVNGLVLLALPVVLGREAWPLIVRVVRSPKFFTAGSLAAFSVLVIQPLLWHAQTGRWLEWGYRGEGFYWDDPKVTAVLFGIRRGLFIWTPVLAASALSVFLLWRHDRVRAGFSVIYWATNTYVISAWWIWYYGGGFGQRVFIDHYPVFAIPLAIILDTARPWLRRSMLLFIGLASAFHFAQLWQYNHEILHHVSMDRSMYAYTFMRFGGEYREVLGGNDQEPPYHPKGMTLLAEELCDFEQPCSLWHGGQIVEEPALALSGTHVCRLDARTEFSITLRLPQGMTPTGVMMHVEIEFDRYEARPRDSFGALAVLSVEGANGTKDYYEPVRMNPLPGESTGAWEHIRYKIPIPIFMDGQQVLFYIWNKDRGTFLLDNMHVKAYSVTPY